MVPQLWTYEHTLAGGQPARGQVRDDPAVHGLDDLPRRERHMQSVCAQHRLPGTDARGLTDPPNQGALHFFFRNATPIPTQGNATAMK